RDRVDLSDLHARDPHFVAGVKRGRRREIRSDAVGTKVDLAHQERRAGHEKGDQANSRDSDESASVHRGGRSPGWGIPLTGNGISARGPALSGGWPASTPRRNPNA